MATSKLLTPLRRHRHCSSLYTLSLSFLNPTSTPLPPLSLSSLPFTPCGRKRSSLVTSFAVFDIFQRRLLSTNHSSDEEGREFIADTEVIDGGFFKEMEGVGVGGSDEDYILPVRAVISMLDGYHELTGFPWWVVIASSTLALRVALLPILILQLHKVKRIGETFPKLPPPFPTPLSGKSFVDQFILFRKERKAAGCPSYLWNLAYVSVQIPCFLIWMTSIRRMSLDKHPGFDCGGALWFQNLTELSHGIFGPIFPLLIAGLHYANIQISFRTSVVAKADGLLAILAKYYKLYLDLLTLPIFVIGYCIPQGSVVYWAANSSLTAIQQLSLRHPAVRSKLGLPDMAQQQPSSGEFDTPKTISSDSPKKWRKIPIENLSPQELVALSVPFLAKGQRESAIPLLQRALDKDPEYTRALIMMGQTLLQKGLHVEAIEYLDHAISKLLLTTDLTVEDVDHLILASQWAGVTCIRQGKQEEGVAHFERLAKIKEPEDPVSKSHYFEGLLLYASALSKEGRNTEAAKYLRLAAAYNPIYNEYLEQLERDDNVIGDLASSRREY